MKISAEQFSRLFPSLSKSRAATYRPLLLAAMEERQITTRKRAIAFLAQLGTESLDLAHLREIWGPTPAQVRYDIRVDLGNTPERDGDGRLYAGRGGIQRTGKNNYRRAEQALGLPLLAHPELLEKPENAFRSDALFWSDNKLNKLADALDLTGNARDLARFDKITKRVNGGYNGRVDRQRRYLVAINTLHDSDFMLPAGELPGAKPDPQPSSNTAIDSVLRPGTNPEEDVDVVAKLSANTTAKAFGKTAGVKIGARVARPFLLLVGALEAGNVYAWIGLIVFIIGAGVIIYIERPAIARGARWISQKLAKAL